MLKLAINQYLSVSYLLKRELFCSINNCYQDFKPSWRKQPLKSGQRSRFCNRRLSLSEILTTFWIQKFQELLPSTALLYLLNFQTEFALNTVLVNQRKFNTLQLL